MVIDRPAGNFTITYSSGTTDINSLDGKEALVTSAGTLSIASASNVSNTLTLSRALSVAGGLTVSGLFTWRSGLMSGTGTTFANGGVAFINPNGKRLRHPQPHGGPRLARRTRQDRPSHHRRDADG